MSVQAIIVYLLIGSLLYFYSKKRIDLFGIYVFLIPYQLVKSDVGLTLYGFQVAILIMYLINVLKVATGNRRNLISCKNSYLHVYIFYALLVTLFFAIATTDIVSSDAGGFFRSDGRFITQIINFLLLFSIVPLAINYVKSFDDIMKYFKVFVISAIVLTILGWLQWAIYNTTGTDIFPLGITADGLLKSGIYRLHGEELFRMSSLGGEPKTLSVTLVFTFFVLQAFNSKGIFFFKYDNVFKYIFILTAFYTLSTSGFVVFALLLLTYIFANFYFGNNLFKFPSRFKSYIIILTTIVLLGVFSETIIEIIQLRVFDREIIKEDFDLVIQLFFIDQPQYLLSGVGLGNAHNYAYPYIPEEFRLYMENQIFTAKSGYLKIISELGLIGFFLFIMFNMTMFKKFKSSSNTSKYKQPILIIFVLIIITFFARLSVLHVYVVIFSMMNALSYWNLKRVST